MTDTIWPVIDRLQQEEPVRWTQSMNYGSFWSITSHDAVDKINKDAVRFISSGGIALSDVIADQRYPMLITLDGADHKEAKLAMAKGFSGDIVRDITSIVGSASTNILYQYNQGGSLDWARGYAHKIASIVAGHLLCLHSRYFERIPIWSAAFSDHANFDLADKLSIIREAQNVMLSEWRHNKLFRDRIKEMNALGTGDGHREYDEITKMFGNIILLIVGGFETISNTLCAIPLAMLTDSDCMRSALADASSIGALAKELLRWQTPLAHMCRTAMTDVELGGNTIRMGDRVVLWLIAANHDKSVFEKSSEIIVNRSNLNRSLAFGAGPHRCLGRNIGLKVVETCLTTISEFGAVMRIVPPYRRSFSTFSRGFDRMFVAIS